MIVDYDKIRQENIARNQSFLNTLGIESKANASINIIQNKRQKVSKVSSEKPDDSIIVRRSSRIASLPPAISLNDNIELLLNEYDNTIKKRKILQKYKDINDIGQEIFDNSKLIKSENHQISSNSSRVIDADYNYFLQHLAEPYDIFGKAAIMQKANYDKLPKFSKYSGVAEWKNCVFLWVNIFPQSSQQGSYPNVFLNEGREIKWYGGSKVHKHSDLTSRLLATKDNSLGINDKILLLVRLEGENYACLGELIVKAYNIDHIPITITWTLLSFEIIRSTSYFQKIYKINMS